MTRSNKSNLKVFGPLAGLVGLLAIASVAATFMGAHEVDESARRREQDLVSNGIRQTVDEIEHAVSAEVVWDDAVAHLDNRYDPAWAEANVGEFLYNTADIERSFVLDSEDRAIYASKDGAMIGTEAYAHTAGAARNIVRQVRLKERQRGPFVHRAPSKQMVAAPIQASEVAKVRGEVVILSATLVQPDFGSAWPKGDRAPITVTEQAVNAAFLQQIASRFELSDLRMVVGGAPRQAGMAKASLNDSRGQVVATLTWTPQKPGAVLMAKALPVMLVAILVLGAAALILFRRGRKAADSLIASEARAHHMAHHDALTGLPNRVLFTERLEHAIEHQRRGKGEVTVLCVDLDRFKDVNDTLGHQCGDELIVEAARRLKSVCRKSDTLARLGGDEFAIVHDGGAQAAATVAARVLEALNGPAELSGGQVHLAGSVGVTVIADLRLDGAEALRQADVALYRAKGSGRGQFCFFEPEMDSALKVRRAVEADLRQALARNEFSMVYQPQVTASGKIVGVEALLRWNHPTRGAVSPAYFIPIAEECGLIDEIGIYTLKNAFSDGLQWPNLKVAVNVSARQLTMPDFTERVEKLLSQTGADARQIELEITEGLLLGDDPETHGTLERLRRLGFSLALDDFGTGYSSLAYLRRFPIDKIKIDRSFISNLGVDAEADAVVKAIVKLARALNLAVIAEGVETQDQQKRLVAAGCQNAQGFLHSRPVPATAISQMMSGTEMKAV